MAMRSYYFLLHFPRCALLHVSPKRLAWASSLPALKLNVSGAEF